MSCVKANIYSIMNIDTVRGDRMKKIYSSIDIGSDSVKMIVAELSHGKRNVLATSSVKSKGISKGLITNMEETVTSIKRAVKEIEDMLGVKVDKVIACVPSYNAEYKMVQASINILNEDKKVTGDHIAKLLKEAVYNNLPKGNEMIVTLPIEFYIDDSKPLRDPKGLLGDVLTVKAVMATTPKKNVYAVITALDRAGLECIDICFNSIGDYYEFKTPDTDSVVGAVVNIGEEMTEVSVFNRGIIVANKVIELGAKSIDKDIAYIYNLEPLDCRETKEKFAFAHQQYANANETYEILNDKKEQISINQHELSEIVMSRLLEILKITKNDLKDLTNKPISYIIVTGGITELPGFKAVVEEVYGKGISIGNIKTIGIRNNKFSSSAGIINYFIEKMELRGRNFSMFDQETEEDLVSTRKKVLNFPNDSMLGKVFGYFFDN